ERFAPGGKFPEDLIAPPFVERPGSRLAPSLEVSEKCVTSRRVASAWRPRRHLNSRLVPQILGKILEECVGPLFVQCIRPGRQSGAAPTPLRWCEMGPSGDGRGEVDVMPFGMTRWLL